jgi:hypothetical protein
VAGYRLALELDVSGDTVDKKLVNNSATIYLINRGIDLANIASYLGQFITWPWVTPWEACMGVTLLSSPDDNEDIFHPVARER